MHISGSGHIPAGEYSEKISVSGSGKLDGNIRCVALSCSGSVKGTGSVSCSEDLRVSGSCYIEKGVSANNISVSGAFKTDEDIRAEKSISISGAIRCGGAIKCTSLSCSGVVALGKDVEAEEIKLSGQIECAGLLNAERIDISLEKSCSTSKVGSLGGSEIRVQSRTKHKITRLPLLGKLLGASGNSLTVSELVEGDIVALECVCAPRVVGRVVAIGTGCQIDLVQYSEEVEIHPDAQVKKYEKI